ncbi:MAG: Hsp70 family protein, partial [Pseudomonadota bacterium]
RIQASGGLSDDDIEKMVKDAEANAEADKKRKEIVEARNSADSMVHETEKNLSEYGDKLEAADKEAIETARNELKDLLDKEDASLEDIQAKTQTLLQAGMKIGEMMYKQQEENAAADGASSEEADKQDAEDVVDAEYEEVDEDKQEKSA